MTDHYAFKKAVQELVDKELFILSPQEYDAVVP